MNVPSLYIAAATIAALLVLAATAWLHTRPRLSTFIVSSCGSRLRKSDAPRPQHAGATERWSPLATIGAQPLSGHALDPAPSLVATHAELAAIGDALVDFSRRVEAALWEFMQPLDADTALKLRAWEWADHTAELDRAALEALLTEGREVACRA